MDIQFLLRILMRRKWHIAAAAILCAVLAFIWAGRKPNQYRATVVLATGIVNYKGINSDKDASFVQQYQVENAFSNLMDFARSRSSIKLLSIQMLMHDLEANLAGKSVAFRQPNLQLYAFEQGREDRELLDMMRKINLDSISDPAFSQEFDFLLDRVSRAYGYDHDAIQRSLQMRRKGDTDNLLIEMVADQPQLAQYMANQFVKRFVTYYHNLSVREKRKNVAFYQKLAEDKKWMVDSIKAIKYEYLRQRGLPALGKQSEELVSSLSQLEMARQKTIAKLQSSREGYDRIQKYIDDRSSLDARETRDRVADKYAVADLNERARQLREESLKSGNKSKEVERELVEINAELEEAILSGARNVGKPRQADESRRTREDLFKEKVGMDIDRIEAEKSLGQIDREIGLLRGKLSAYVVNDEIANKLESDQKIAEDEFSKVNAQLVEARLALENSENRLIVIENAQLPEWAEPKRRSIITAFAGITGGVLSTIGVFLLAFLDMRVRNLELLKKYLGPLPVLGVIAATPVKGLDLGRVFGVDAANPKSQQFRESLRRLRSIILQSDARVYLFLSASPARGKTFAMHALAFSLAANQKRVLLIDTNFKNPLPEAYIELPTPRAQTINQIIREHRFERVFALKQAAPPDTPQQPVDVLGNSGSPLSPSEQFTGLDFGALCQAFAAHYDYIFLEAAALNDYSDARELIAFADASIVVFNAAYAVSAADQGSIQSLSDPAFKCIGAILTQVEPDQL